MSTKVYLPFIDGLRALAVLPVVFFHADFKLFEGGFVGVDVFFVISGFLITRLIIEDIENNKFSLSNFYFRRARRILPILFFIIFISIFFAIALMSSDQLKLYVSQIYSVIFFISNFFFWQNTGYFDPSTEIQPLLHTWSLAVEEQFYIFFPLFLMFVYRFLRKKIFFLIILISLLSLILSQIGGNFKLSNISLSYPFFNLPFEFFWQAGSANFYLPFGRAWELLIGSLIALSFKKKIIRKEKYSNFLSFLGFTLILFSIFFYSQIIQYPSIYTLLPCFGTALLIIYTNKKTVLFKILTYKPVVQLGLISYSFYLWHQPIFSFSRIYFGIDLSIFNSLILIVFSLILSIFSWRYIEQPFRQKKKINNKSFLISLLIFIFVIFVISSLIKTNRLKSLQPDLPQNLKETIKMSPFNNCIDIEYAHVDDNQNWFCVLGKKSIKKNISFAVIGDSHAQSLFPLFHSLANQKEIKGVLTGFSGCPGLLGVQSIRSDMQIKNCKLLAEKFYNFVKKNKIQKIFLVSRWTYYTDGEYSGNQFQHVSDNDILFSNKQTSRKSLVNGLENTLKKYQALGTDVIFVHQTPMQIFDPYFIYSNSYDEKNKKINLEKIENYSIDLNKSLDLQKFIRLNVENLKKIYSNLISIDLNDFFCEDNKCLVGNEKASYYADDDHLSIQGAKFLIKKFEKYLK